MAQQILFERWLPQEDLLFRRQGIPLLLGVDPEAFLPFLMEAGLMGLEEALWARLAIEFPGSGGGLANPGEGPDYWRIPPRDLYGYAALRGIPVPFAFEQLIQFIAKAVPPPLAPEPPVARSGRPADPSERETLLGAALNVVAKCPHECTDANGFVDGVMVAGLIRARERLWFAERPLSLSDAEVAALIEQWLV
jgi:hypothetical protein